jgi:hypothetical protein
MTCWGRAIGNNVSQVAHRLHNIAVQMASLSPGTDCQTFYHLDLASTLLTARV